MLVIFDCDGVLVDSEVLSNEALREVLAEVGVELTLAETMHEFLGRSRVHMLARTAELLAGVPVPPDFGARYDRRRDVAFRAAPLAIVDGVLDALDAIEAAGFETCVASSGDHQKMRYTLGMTGLWERFEGRIFSASEVEHGKPAPDLFLHAAARMSAAEAVVVEDAPAGVAAARAAGMRVFGYRVAADVTFDDMRELPGLL